MQEGIVLKEPSPECFEAKTWRHILRVETFIRLPYLVWLYPWAVCPVHMGMAADYMIPGVKDLTSPTDAVPILNPQRWSL